MTLCYSMFSVLSLNYNAYFNISCKIVVNVIQWPNISIKSLGMLFYEPQMSCVSDFHCTFSIPKIK